MGIIISCSPVSNYQLSHSFFHVFPDIWHAYWKKKCTGWYRRCMTDLISCRRTSRGRTHWRVSDTAEGGTGRAKQASHSCSCISPGSYNCAETSPRGRFCLQSWPGPDKYKLNGLLELYGPRTKQTMNTDLSELWNEENTRNISLKLDFCWIQTCYNVCRGIRYLYYLICNSSVLTMFIKIKWFLHIQNICIEVLLVHIYNAAN